MVSLLLLLLSILTGATPDPVLSSYAQERAVQQGWYHNIAHYPQACGVGELLGDNIYDADTAVLMWWYSLEHRIVGFQQEWDRVGVGYHDGFVVATFANDC